MKLYTEEQVIDAIEKAMTLDSDCEGVYFLYEDAKAIIKELTPIKIPSDEEIEKESSKWRAPSQAFRGGAKWVIEQLKNNAH